MSMWKYFKDSEVKGLNDFLVEKLDTTVRPIYGRPLVITSGYRSVERNSKVGGVKDSAHTSGLAVDLRCAGFENQVKLAWALGLAGFDRLGVYDKHLHADLDKLKPNPAIWFGGKSK